jgi:hypothetical protein
MSRGWRSTGPRLHGRSRTSTHAAVDLVAAAPCLTVLIRPPSSCSSNPVTAAVCGDPSDAAVLAAAVDLAELGRVGLRLLHARPLPLYHSDTSAERGAAQAVLESARRQILRLAPAAPQTLNWLALTPTKRSVTIAAGCSLWAPNALPILGLGWSLAPRCITRTHPWQSSTPQPPINAGSEIRRATSTRLGL